MELIERTGFMDTLQAVFNKVTKGEGHCMLVSGEAGIGKTSLVKAFCKSKQDDATIYQGTCDALFAPRPLAPLYDIIWRLQGTDSNWDMADRAGLFARLFHELGQRRETIIIVFEDIHWADEATLDFIKFLARRITGLRCLFILTYRDNEIHGIHPLRHVLGQLPPDSFTRMQLPPLSRQAVEKLAEKKGYRGEDVYSITGGNPFYVNEILASYSTGIPENIKDSVLSVYNRQHENTKRVWTILSVLPTGLETRYLERLEPLYTTAIENCLGAKILVVENNTIRFKHELYRRTIETSLSPFVRVDLNKKILDLLRESFESHDDIERIIHHAKNANEYDMVVHYAPIAARRAAFIGAHIEASRLYLSAIEYYQGADKDMLVGFYESYAYECYLINRIKDAIIYQTKALAIWKEKNDIQNTGNSMRFLSRLWWFDGNRRQAENYGSQAIDTLADQPSSKAKAMAFSNMSQLKMLADQREECMYWGEKAIAMAKELGDEEILSHALNNVGDIQVRNRATMQQGIALLQQSLDIALQNSYHEHAARAYTNLGSSGLSMKDFALAERVLKDGIHYCEERDLDSWKAYMLSDKARLYLHTGRWQEAYNIVDGLLKNEGQPPIIKIGALVVMATVRMRRGEDNVLPLLHEARIMAFDAMELQRIIPVLVALLEYEWITGQRVVEKQDIGTTINMMKHMGNVYENSVFAYWLGKVRQQQVPLRESFEGYMYNSSNAGEAARTWAQLGCPYEEALAFAEGDDADKRKAATMVHTLGADAVYEKMKQEMRSSGITGIPRGIRKTTRSNVALLTGRELDVLQLLKEGLQNKEIANRLFISAKTVDHHISSILFKLDVNSRAKAVQEAIHLEIIK